MPSTLFTFYKIRLTCIHKVPLFKCEIGDFLLRSLNTYLHRNEFQEHRYHSLVDAGEIHLHGCTCHQYVIADCLVKTKL